MDKREQIKAARDFESELVECPEWGVTLEIRSFSAKMRSDVFIKARTENEGDVDMLKWQLILIASTCYDPETGSRIFEDNDIEWLSDKDPDVLERISNVSMRLNGLDKESIVSAEKNS